LGTAQNGAVPAGPTSAPAADEGDSADQAVDAAAWATIDQTGASQDVTEQDRDWDRFVRWLAVFVAASFAACTQLKSSAATEASGPPALRRRPKQRR
jgi:hypothetical protein